MYFKAPLVQDAESQRSTSSRAFKWGIAFIGGSCLVFLSVMAMSASGPSAAESTNLLGMLASSRFSSRASPVLPQTFANQLPGPSPWKELALAGIEAAKSCNRDVSLNAGVKSVLASMHSKDRAILARAEGQAIKTAKDLQAGMVAPLSGVWDPFGLSTELDQGKLLFYREAEIKHGRLCMLATLGIVAGERFHPLFGGNVQVNPYTNLFQADLQSFWFVLGVLIFGIEAQSPFYGPDGTISMPEDRVPGDVGFDPLNLKPKKPQDLLQMQNKEILNGRLAMIAFSGIIAQELVTGKLLSD